MDIKIVSVLGLFILLPLTTPLSHNWTRQEVLDGNGLYILEWHVRDQHIVFKTTVNTRGFIALGFINPNVKDAFDLVLSWVDDRSGKANVLVSFLRYFILKVLISFALLTFVNYRYFLW